MNDDFRADYFRGYINALAKARVEDGVDVRGYLAWSLLEYVSSPTLTRSKWLTVIPSRLATSSGQRAMRLGSV